MRKGACTLKLTFLAGVPAAVAVKQACWTAQVPERVVLYSSGLA